MTVHIDSALGIKNVWSDIASYSRFLLKYDEIHGDDVSKLRISLVQGDENKTRCLIHSLKGISGMLGLSRVHNAAVALENALKEKYNSTIIEHLVVALDVEQHSVSAAIKDFVIISKEK